MFPWYYSDDIYLFLIGALATCSINLLRCTGFEPSKAEFKLNNPSAASAKGLEDMGSFF